MTTQTRNGKALEYAFLKSLESKLNAENEILIVESNPLATARTAYLSFEEASREQMDLAADAGIDILLRLEPRLHLGANPLQLTLQQDAAGQAGDVRDVLAIRSADDWEIGISCKNNHTALKHSRLSPTIDIGRSWFGYQSTDSYFNEIRPIFEELQLLRAEGVKWRDLTDKAERYYIPILEALISELRRLDTMYPGEIPRRLLSYLLGRNDFYKAIVNTRSRTTELQGFNLYGTLNMRAIGRNPQLRMPLLRLPSRIYEIHFKENSDNTIIIVCDEGWTISARIHSASTTVESSLKLDVKLIGLPPTLYRHVEPWNI
ncbi:HaeIII family restriction endonuclease [Mesobacillus subterraneus]|uniref:HaeIII family restriction endonuclease n=1 Tax=Mesobacillus subterraneus TaxID=285983 RepID=UPI001CFCCDAF|nr:HaeIII family restriction endonuclease [Mesobacillus subterraneus]WLR55940.1 HaeIII family restriction endonuclease [Mesobacillus subterraneus]